MSVLRVVFDTSELEATARSLGEIADGGAINRGAVRAVNEVIDRTYDTARKRMNAGINLDDQYISRKLTVTRATAKPQGSITAAGDLTVLGRYDPKLILKPVKHPGRSKGDPSRRIPAGLKAGGVRVQVTRGVPKAIDNGFLMPLRNGNGIGVFTRSADGTVTNRYGPSVYQLFRATVDVMHEEIETDLQETATGAIYFEIQKALQ